MKLKSLARKRDLMKDSFVKDNYLISIGISSVSRLNSNPIVREKSRRERGYCIWRGHEAENKIGSFIWDFLFEKEIMKHNQLIINSFFQFYGLTHITKMNHEADEQEKGSWCGGIRGDAK